MTRVVVATGTKRESAVLQGSGWAVIPGGGDAQRLHASLVGAAKEAELIVSFGMAGALSPDLAIGDWVIADRVTGAVDAGCDPMWQERFAVALPGGRISPVYADGRMIVSAAEKSNLATRTGAAAVDMESHVAAAVASEQGLRLAVVRCVSDLAEQSLPPAFLVAMRPDGGVAMSAMLGSLLAHPRQIGNVLRVGGGFARAMRSLRNGGRRLVADAR